MKATELKDDELIDACEQIQLVDNTWDEAQEPRLLLEELIKRFKVETQTNTNLNAAVKLLEKAFIKAKEPLATEIYTFLKLLPKNPISKP